MTGRRFRFNDAGLADLEAILLWLADKRRRETSPRVSERLLIIRAAPESPYVVTQALLERAARAGFYKFEFGEPSRAHSHESRPEAASRR